MSFCYTGAGGSFQPPRRARPRFMSRRARARGRLACRHSATYPLVEVFERSLYFSEPVVITPATEYRRQPLDESGETPASSHSEYVSQAASPIPARPAGVITFPAVPCSRGSSTSGRPRSSPHSFSFSFCVMNAVTLSLTRWPARSLRTGNPASKPVHDLGGLHPGRTRTRNLVTRVEPKPSDTEKQARIPAHAQCLLEGPACRFVILPEPVAPFNRRVDARAPTVRKNPGFLLEGTPGKEDDKHCFYLGFYRVFYLSVFT